MTTVAILNIIVVLFAYLARYKQTKFGLKVSFFLIFLFLALRYDYGNDYPAYFRNFFVINQCAWIDYFSKSFRYEPGWIFLCRLFEPLGFFAMTAVLALFNCIVYYRFIKKYVPPAYYWFAVFLYVFTPGFMLVHSSAMRQSVAITLFIFSIDYLYKKDAIRYFLCVGLASLFHYSALILLPVYFIGLFNWKINKITAVSIFSLFLFLFMFGELYKSQLNLFISTYFRKYATYQGGLKIGTGLGLVFYSSLFALVLFYERFQIKEIALLFKIAILGYFIMPLGLLLSLISRVGMYFQPATLAVFPILLLNIKNPIFKNLILVLIIFITIYSFYGFFQSDTWSVAFGTYRTIFSSPEIY